MFKVLFIIAAALELITVPVFLKYYWPDRCKKSLIMKMVSSVLFVLAGYFAIKASGNSSGYADMIFWGLVFGCIGDFFLHSLKGKIVDFAIGLVAFLAGHVFYILAFIKATKTSYPARGTFAWYEILVVLLGVAGMIAFSAAKGLFKTKGPIMAGVTVYTAVLLTMLVKALRYAIGEIAYGTNDHMVMVFITVAVGALLFFMSDTSLGLILGTDKKTRGLRIFNILTYYSAQILLAASIFFVSSRELYPR
ncbi:MAG: lysoplasmalogenase [Oscillospiraceae bacterium]|nr:lysoplasmalogenase [Oscillospiraceae bacterium]